MGRPTIVTRPTMTMMMEITMATIERLMKSFDTGLFARRCCSRLHWSGDKVRRNNRQSFADFLKAFNDHALTGMKSLFDDPHIGGPISNPHRLNMDFVAG